MILSRSFLTRESERRAISEYGYSRTRIINENAQQAIRFDSMGTKVKGYDVFLSHSSLDKKLVLTIVNLFNEAGYSVYVDWIEDQELDRNNVTSNTANILRTRMNSSRGLSYVATSNISNSKWCPWELGYFDGKKNSRCCILPIVESGSFSGQEYLGLYPYLQYSTNMSTNKYDFWVYEQGSNKYIVLNEWLRGTNPMYH